MSFYVHLCQPVNYVEYLTLLKLSFVESTCFIVDDIICKSSSP